MKEFAIIAGAGAVATASTLALNPFSASATDATTTTTTTVTGSAQATTGQTVKFTAKVSPSKTTAPVTKATGTVTFTIVDNDAKSVSCAGGNSATLTATGRAFCRVSANTLTAASSPYTVTASYSGGNGFGPSTGTLSQTVSLAPTRVRVSVDGPPTSTTASTFTATVTGGSGLPTGTVTLVCSPTSRRRGRTIAAPVALRRR